MPALQTPRGPFGLDIPLQLLPLHVPGFKPQFGLAPGLEFWAMPVVPEVAGADNVVDERAK